MVSHFAYLHFTRGQNYGARFGYEACNLVGPTFSPYRVVLMSANCTGGQGIGVAQCKTSEHGSTAQQLVWACWLLPFSRAPFLASKSQHCGVYPGFVLLHAQTS